MDINEAFRVLERPMLEFPNFYRHMHLEYPQALMAIRTALNKIERPPDKCKKCKRANKCISCKKKVDIIICEKCDSYK